MGIVRVFHLYQQDSVPFFNDKINEFHAWRDFEAAFVQLFRVETTRKIEFKLLLLKSK